MKISVVIQTFNSETHLRNVLESVKRFDEIVVCDMHSTDKTLEIAKQYGCKIVFSEKFDIVEPSRNFAIQSASNEWVLLVDSDEVVPDALASYLYEKIEKQDDFQALWIARKNYLFGRFLHSEYPDYILRFFKKDCIDWPPFVHSRPTIKGTSKHIPKSRKDLAFIHLANNTISQKLKKMDTYTNDEINRRKNQSFPLLKMFFASSFRFLKSYILKGGFRDGKAGLTAAYIDSFYKFVTIAKIWENQFMDKIKGIKNISKLNN